MLVGELRDLETVAIAIETAETGHLVFGTLHTTTAASTVDRVIDQFPTDRQAQIRIMLSESLRGVIAQNLCRKIGGGRVAALEVLMVTQAVSNLIREGKTFQIPSMMQVGKNIGMVSLNDALMELVTKKLVAPDEALSKAVDKAGFEALLKRGGAGVGRASENGRSPCADRSPLAFLLREVDRQQPRRLRVAGVSRHLVGRANRLVEHLAGAIGAHLVRHAIPDHLGDRRFLRARRRTGIRDADGAGRRGRAGSRRD